MTVVGDDLVVQLVAEQQRIHVSLAAPRLFVNGVEPLRVPDDTRPNGHIRHKPKCCKEIYPCASPTTVTNNEGRA